MSGTLKITVDCMVSGPLADGRAIDAAEKWAERTSQVLGDQAVRMLRDFPMNKTGRARGGFENLLQTERRTPSETRVMGPQQRGVAWASWLEGTSKRNQGNRFKGYHLFAKTRKELQDKAADIGQRELDKLLSEMGGA
jgi:hypothetical protein